MIFPQIQCSHQNRSDQQFIFYVLCKGNNAGQPALKPWTNSFEIICADQEHFDFYFWLVYGLFKGGSFKKYIRGTAVPFINIADVRTCIKEVSRTVFADWHRFRDLIKTMEQIDKLRSNLLQQVVQSESLQQHLIRHYFKEIK